MNFIAFITAPAIGFVVGKYVAKRQYASRLRDHRGQANMRCMGSLLKPNPFVH